jgi:hypothetical protein
MTIVQITCPECSTRAVVPIVAVLLVVSAPEMEDEHGGLAVWICLNCRSLVGRAVGWADFVCLASAGGSLLEEAAVLRPHPEAPAAGPMWVYDDVLDLHLLLHRPDWFIELERLTPVSDVRP